MRRVPKVESLPALKALLHDLENTNLVYPDDLSVRSLRRSLRKKIAELEAGADSEVRAMAAD